MLGTASLGLNRPIRHTVWSTYTSRTGRQIMKGITTATGLLFFQTLTCTGAACILYAYDVLGTCMYGCA